MNILPILSNRQNGMRNAKVYKTANGEYGVLIYDATNDYDGLSLFPTQEQAEDFAEDWVNNHDTV